MRGGLKGYGSAPKAPTRPPRMNLVKPNYSARTPIVNDGGFTDGPREPTLGSAQASFNPGGNAAALPNGPPRYINAPGKSPRGNKSLSNKRLGSNI